jgi:hypothetical protein
MDLAVWRIILRGKNLRVLGMGDMLVFEFERADFLES